jgi:RHS repeat-associated protein
LAQRNLTVKAVSKAVAQIAQDPPPSLEPADIQPAVLSVLLRNSSELKKASVSEAAVAPPPASAFEYKGMVDLSKEVSGAVLDVARDEQITVDMSVPEPATGRLELVAGSVIGTRLSLPPAYDDERGEFETKDGVLSLAQDGPQGASGKLYQPEREQRSVRYEYRSSTAACPGGIWIEHDPSGTKRYYGCDANGQKSAKVTTELGTFEWLLVSEVDAHGNSIDYTYHNVDGTKGQSRLNLYEPQDQPILATVQWGGNSKAGVQHQYKVTTRISTQYGGMDALRGHVLLNHRIDTIDVASASGPNYWSYDLIYTMSADSGSQLLSEVKRREGLVSSQVTRSWRLSYSSNGGTVRWGAPQELPGPVGTAYVQHPWLSKAEYLNNLKEPRYKDTEVFAAIWPWHSRSGVKITDYNGDGLADYHYNVSNVVVPQAPSINLTLQGTGNTWNPKFIRPIFPGDPSMMSGDGAPPPPPNDTIETMPEGREQANLKKMGGLTAHDFADVDGDNWLDMVGFDVVVEGWESVFGNMRDVLGGDPSVCRAFWSGCCESGLTCSPNTGCITSSTCVESLDPTQSIIRNPEQLLAEMRLRPQTEVRLGRLSSQTGGGPVPYVGAGCSALAKAMCTSLFPDSLGYLSRNQKCEAPDPCDINYWAGNFACMSECENQRPFHGRSNTVFINGEPNTLHDWPVPAMQKFVLARKYMALDEAARESLRKDPIPFETYTSSGIETQMIDVDGSGMADLVLIKSKLGALGGATGFEYLPRVYLNRGALSGIFEGAPDAGDVIPGYLLDNSRFILDAEKKGVQQFSHSLNGILLGGRREACYLDDDGDKVFTNGLCAENDTRHPYPKQQQFSSFFLDLNADGLPDLVSATPPEQKNNDFGKCQLGHRVHLNRGYRWDGNEQLALPGQTWSANGPLTRTKNYSPEQARFTANQTTYTGYCDSAGFGFNPEVTARADFEADELTPTDINGDGRVDLVFSVMHFTPGPWSESALKQAVYLNTGRGFMLAPKMTFPNVNHSAYVVVPGATSLGGEVTLQAQPFNRFFTKLRQSNWADPNPDLGRIVDMNGDTLPDLVIAGTCTVEGPPCTRAQWIPNLNVIPDLLTRVETNGGAWTNVGYEVASTTAGRQLLLDSRVPPGAVVVKEVRRAATPIAPVETIALRYGGYVNDPVRSENLGFTMIQAMFTNAVPSGITASKDNVLTVTQFYHRNVEEDDLDGATAHIPYPLKGLPLEVQTVGTTNGTTYTTRQRTEYAIETVGDDAIRIRQAGNYRVEQTGNMEQATGTEVLAWDAYGYPTRTRSGNAARIGASDRFAILEDQQMVEQAVETKSVLRSWVLGLSTHEQLSGFTRDEHGVSKDLGLLAEVQRTYDDQGLVLSERRLATRDAEDCTAGSEDVPTYYSYYPHGLVLSASKGEREMRFTYDTETGGLKGITHTTWATRYVDGVAQRGALTPLSETRYLDPRTGAVESVVDANGATWTTAFDSFGRPLQKVGPSAQVLAVAAYFDDYPAYSTETTYVDQNKGSTETTFVDGFGGAIASVRTGSGVQPVRTAYVIRDAFGQEVATYPPVVVPTKSVYAISDLRPTSSEIPAVARFDSFGRQTYSSTPDGRETWSDYEPAVTWSTNPRGYATRTQVDWRGNIEAVDRYGVDAASAKLTNAKPAASFNYERDGAGKLLRVLDADGFVRDLTYDGLGRLYKAALPRDTKAASETATLCYDEHDDIVEYIGATGKEGRIERDELGRTIRSVAEDPEGQAATVNVYASYDNPQQGRFALGKQWRVLDGSGARELAYSDLGQISQVIYSPSNEVLGFGGKPMDVQQVRLSMGYSLMGALTTAKVQGVLGGSSAPATVTYGQYNFTLDSAGRTTRVAEPSSSTYSPIFGSSLISDAQYDAYDALTGVAFGSDINVSWEYEPLSHRLTSARYTLSGELDPFVQLAYAYDKNNNLLSESRWFGEGDSYVKQHGYNALDRLVSSAAQKSGASRKIDQFSYSPGGNLLRVNRLSYQYRDPSNAQAVTQILGSGYQRNLEYDADGALEYDEDNNKEISLDYDASGCLRRVDADIDGTNTVNEYICNEEGKRSARLTRRGTDVERVIFVGDLVELRPDDGDQGEVLVRLPLAGNVAFEDVRDLRSGLRDEERSGYLVKDIRGSVLAKVSYDLDRDLPRVEYEEAEYSPWGETIGLSSLPKPTHQFVDREPDPGVGYYQFGVRTYDPSLKRWLSPDPLFFGNPDLDAGSGAELNLYAYAANNPVINVDKTGNAIESLWDAASLAMGIASFKDNWSKGNALGAVMDGIGIALDAAALATPFVPGGVGAVINIARGADKVNDLRKAAKTTDAAVDTVRTADRVNDASKAGKAANNAPTPKADAGKPKVENGGGPSSVKGEKTYQTYTKTHATTGEVYSGRTSGRGTPEDNIAKRDKDHHKNKDGFGPAVLDKSSSNPAAIRGREQQLIEANGGARSAGGTSGNKINGVSPSNENRQSYLDAANEEF